MNYFAYSDWYVNYFQKSNDSWGACGRVGAQQLPLSTTAANEHNSCRWAQQLPLRTTAAMSTTAAAEANSCHTHNIYYEHNSSHEHNSCCWAPQLPLSTTAAMSATAAAEHNSCRWATRLQMQRRHVHQTPAAGARPVWSWIVLRHSQRDQVLYK